MNVRVWLKNGNNSVVENLTKINEVYSDLNVNSLPFENFFISENCTYHFFGKKTISVTGNCIEYLEFY